MAFALSGSIFAMFLYIVLYLENVLGYSALQAGLIFLLVSLLSFLVGPVAGKLSARLPVGWFLGARGAGSPARLRRRARRDAGLTVGLWPQHVLL